MRRYSKIWVMMQDKEHSIISCNVMAAFVSAVCFMFVVSIYFDTTIRWYNHTSLSINVITDLLFLSLLVLICAVTGIVIFLCIRKVLVFTFIDKQFGKSIWGKPHLLKRPIQLLAAVATITFMFFWFMSWRSTMPGDDWPRDFPYPDRLLLWIHSTIDQARPAGLGRIKIEGEWPIIRYLLSYGTLISLIAMMGSLLLLNWNRLIHFIWMIRRYDKGSETEPDIIDPMTNIKPKKSCGGEKGKAYH